MMRRKLNLAFLSCLVGVIAVIAVITHLVHSHQVKRNLGAVLDRARQTEAAGEPDKTIGYLRRYLVDRPEDGEAWAWLARVMDESARRGGNRLLVYEAFSQAVGLNPENDAIRRRAAALALELERWSDAENHLETLLKPTAGKAALTAPETADLEDQLGRCAQGKGDMPKARDWYRRALSHEASRIATSERLARLLRDDLKDPAEADRVVAAMVKANPKSGLAYLARWNYARRYGLEVDDGDIAHALRLDPDAADILRAATGLAARRGDWDEARRLAARALERHPDQAESHLLSASLELQADKPDQAEAVLHRAAKAFPDNAEIGFILADHLINRRKLDGPDGAEAQVGTLRDRNLSPEALKYLEAALLMARGEWLEDARKRAELISRLDSARTTLASDPHLSGRINRMLSECLGRDGKTEARLAALKRAAESPEAGTATRARVTLAAELEANGQLDEAMAQYLLLARSRPEARLDVARVAIRQVRQTPRARQDWRAAEQRVKEAVEAVPTAAADLALLNADLLSARQRHGEARQAIESALRTTPKDVRLWRALAASFLDTGEPAKAREALDRAEQGLGPSVGLTLARVGLWSQIGGDEAKSALDRIADAVPSAPASEQASLLDALGAAWLRLGERGRARRAWGRLIERQPENVRALELLGGLALEDGDHPEVGRIENLLRKVEGEDGTIWRFLAAESLIDRARRGDHRALEQAESVIGEISLRRRDWWGVPLLQARRAEAEGRLDAAIRFYQEAIKRGGTKPDVALRLARLLDQLGRLDELEALVASLADSGLELEDLKLATAFLAVRKGEFDRAVELARQTLSEDSNDPSDHVTLGKILMAAGRAEEAEREFRRAVELGPDAPGVWVAYVESLVQAGRLDRAKATTEAARKALPTERSALAVARCYALTGDLKEADAQYQTALKASPADPTALRLAAEFYMGQEKDGHARAEDLLSRLLDPATGASEGDRAWARRSQGMLKVQGGSVASIDEALKRVHENLKSNPSSLDDQRALAVLLALVPGRRGEAIRELQSRDRVGSLDPEQRFLLVLLHLAENDREAAEALLLRLLGGEGRWKDPRHLAVMVGLQIDGGKLKEAGRWLAELKSRGPADAGLIALEGRLLRAQKRESELLSLIRNYALSHPDQTAAVATLFDQFGFVKEAEEQYRQAVEAKPADPQRLALLLGFLGRKHHMAEALALWERTSRGLAVETAAELGTAIVAMPSATDAQRQQVEAWLVQALKARPASRLLQLKLAYVRMSQGRFDEAQDLYRQILASNPDEPEALNNLAILLAFQDDPGKRDEAAERIDRAIAVAGAVPPLLDTRATVHLRRGQPQKAFADLRQALAADPRSSIFHFHLAQAYHQSGDDAEAKKAFDQAERLGLSREKVDRMERDEYDRLRRKLIGG